MSNKRYDIQILRAIAIIAVIIIHTYPHNLAGVIIRALVNFAVALFFFLSGYLTNISIDSKKLLKRLKKVIIPYIVWSVIYICFTRKSGVDIQIDKILVALLTGTCSYHLYFVIVYVQLTVLTKACFILLHSRFKYIGLLITPIALLIFQYIMPFYGILISKEFVNINFLMWFSYYYIGLGIGNEKLPCISLRTAIMSVFFTFIFSISEGLFWYGNGNYVMATTQCRLSSCLYALAAIILCANILESNYMVNYTGKIPVLILLGELSGGIYYCHVLIIKVLRFLGRTIPLIATFPVISLLTLFITVIGVLLVKKLCSGKICASLGF